MPRYFKAYFQNRNKIIIISVYKGAQQKTVDFIAILNQSFSFWRESENIQHHLQKFISESKGRKLNMASRIDISRSREAGVGGKKRIVEIVR